MKLRACSKTLLYGSYKEYEPGNPYVYMYERRLGKTSYMIICSFAKEPIPFILPKGFAGHTAKLVLSNYPRKRKIGEVGILPKTGLRLSPYEAMVIKMKRV